VVVALLQTPGCQSAPKWDRGENAMNSLVSFLKIVQGWGPDRRDRDPTPEPDSYCISVVSGVADRVPLGL